MVDIETGVRVYQTEGKTIYGVISFDGICFKAQLKYDFPQTEGYSLEIMGGKRNWKDANEATHSGWDYFGTNRWAVSGFKIRPGDNSISLFVPMGLRKSDKIEDERVYDVVLQQASGTVDRTYLPIVTDDFVHLIRDRSNNIIFLTEVHIAEYDIQEKEEKEEREVTAMVETPLIPVEDSHVIEEPPGENDAATITTTTQTSMMPAPIWPLPSHIKGHGKKKCASCTIRQPRNLFHVMPNGRLARTCKHCLASVNVKRILRFPSRAISK